jgi:DNA-binding CsgD family transcriptional regulator
VVLVAGEAGVGKTRLVDDVTKDTAGFALWGRASQGAATPYGPFVAALRAHLRNEPDGLDGVGTLRPHLALLLPELGEPARAGDRATLIEALRAALAAVAAAEPVAIVLDDLHWSDEATLELLPELADALERLELVVIGIYRSDGLPREHQLRRVRHALRRAGELEEIVVEPLDAERSAELLAEVLGQTPSPSLAMTIHQRTQGIPFFTEELARALLVNDAVAPSGRGVELTDAEVPLPETVRDAVLAASAELTDEGREAAAAAAVAGEEFEIGLVAQVSNRDGVQELVARGMVAEGRPGIGAFRHTLTREALYSDIPWLQRRDLHRRLAEALEAAGGRSSEIATHWLGAREEQRAREALLHAAGESRSVHAYRDAVAAARQALDLWPEESEQERRLAALEDYAESAALCGDLGEAGRAWREICALRARPGERADAQRELARIYDLQGTREAAFAARSAAAEAYERGGRRAEAAVERLALGNYLRAGASYGATIEMARAAGRTADAAGRLDLRLRADGLEGVAVAKSGRAGEGLEIVRSALARALEHELTAVAADLYQRLSLVLYDAADYREAQETLDTALALCRTTDRPALEVACVTCMVYVLRERGEWDEALRIGRELIESDTAVWVAEGLMGMIYGLQGKLSSARRMLTSCYATASRVEHFNMSVDSTTGLARVAAAEGADEEAAEHIASLLERWKASEDHHYSIKGLRWGAGFFARREDVASAHSCAEALTRISSETGHPDALAALAFAIGETALADGEPETAASQLGQAVELHRGLDLPLERAEIELRAGVALAAAGEREIGLERLRDAHRGARKLGARPLASEAAGEVAELGESVGRRLGSRAQADVEGAGLTPRELEVVRLVAVGRTNREVAEELVLSTRTVDMHVRNVLRKLDCRSRVEAANRANELGLLA